MTTDGTVRVPVQASAGVDTPAAGKARVHVDTDGLVKAKDSTGTTVTPAALPANNAFTGQNSFGATAPSVRIPFASNQHIDAAAAGTTDKVGHELSTTVTGDLSTSTGADPTFAWGLNVFTTTGTAANDAKGGNVSNLIETDVQAPSGTIAVVQGLVVQGAFFGASAGATVTQMESLRVAAPVRKNGAVAGTATNVYGLFVETVSGAAVGASGAAFSLFVNGGVSRFGGRIDAAGSVVNTTGNLELFADFSRAAGASFVLDANASGLTTGNATVYLSKSGSALKINDGTSDVLTIGRNGVVTFTQSPNFGGKEAVNAADPTVGSSLGTKNYIDAVATGVLSRHFATALASTNQALSGLPTLDTVTLTAGQIALLTNQSTPSQNGLWAVAVGAWTRPSFFATGSDAVGSYVIIEQGNTYIGSEWFATGAGPITVDTTAQTWVQINGAYDITVDVTLTKTGNQLSRAATTGDVVIPVSSNAATIQPNAVTNAKAAQMAAHTLKGNNTGGASNALDLTVAQVAADLPLATTAAQGLLSATQLLELNALDGRDSAGSVKRVFRPADYMVGNTYDPTGVSNSTTSFQAMMTAVNALNDRCIVDLAPGVFKVDSGVIAGLGTAPFKIRGPGRGVCVLIPNNSTSDFVKFGAADGNAAQGFAIYNTSGTPFTANAGINTNDADSVLIEDMMFVDLFYDIRVNGRPVTATTNSTINVSGISPVLTAGDVGKPFNGVGIPTGTTIATQAGATCTLSAAATTSATATFFVGNTIKCSIQRTLHSQSNGNGSSVGIRVENGDAGDTYIGPDVVMSNTGATRRRASVELIASGHYEITQANLTGSAQAVLVDPGASQIVAFGFHQQVLCDSCSVNGMTLNAVTATSTIKNIKSVDSWYSGTITGTGGAGVVTTGTGAGIIDGVTFSNDRFLNNQTHGFQHGFGTDFRWDNCDMRGNSKAADNTSDGLNVAAGVSNWSVAGGKYGGSDTVPTAPTPGQRYGINVLAGAGDNIKIAADDLTGNKTGPLSMNATGLNVYLYGCPGLPAPFSRGAPSGSISTVITLANMLIPKNSVRVGTVFRLSALVQHITLLGTDTFTVRCGTTNDAVGSASTNAVVVSAVSAGGAANDWVTVEFLVTVSAIGASGNINSNGGGLKGAATAFGTATAARASGAGFLAVDTTADKYLTLALAASAGADIAYSSNIEVVNY